MVQCWNDDPSDDISKCVEPPRHIEGGILAKAPRFARECTREDRIPNFVNGTDPQGNEQRNTYVDVNTNTHTKIEDRLATTKAVLQLADQVENSLWSVPAVKSERVKAVTNKTLLSNDVRFEVLKDSSPEELGPGTYWVEGGRPGIGTLSPSHPSRGASPSKDPLRISAPFISPPRPTVFPPKETPDRVYISPDYRPAHDSLVPWGTTCHDTRRDTRDYRHPCTVRGGSREVPIDAEYPGCERKNQASQLTNILDVTGPHGGSPAPYMDSKESRIGVLPKERLNDTRLSRPRWDEDPAALGPGTYGPLISIGGAKKKTYRLFADLPPRRTTQPASHHKAAAGPLRPTSSRQHPDTSRQQQQHYKRMSASPRKDPRSASAAFSSPPRHIKSGPFNWATDSTLVRH